MLPQRRLPGCSSERDFFSVDVFKINSTLGDVQKVWGWLTIQTRDEVVETALDL